MFGQRETTADDEKRYNELKARMSAKGHKLDDIDLVSRLISAFSMTLLMCQAMQIPPDAATEMMIEGGLIVVKSHNKKLAENASGVGSLDDVLKSATEAPKS